MLLGGFFTTVQGQTRNHVARVGLTGALDTGFNPNADDVVWSLAVQSDGKVLLGGSFTTVGGMARSHISRVNSNGTVDTGFNPNADNTVESVVVQPDGKILLGGEFGNIQGTPRNYLARVSSTGTLDASFDPNPDGGVLTMAVQADGKVLFGGYFDVVQGISFPGLARVDANGVLDTGFGQGQNSDVFSVALQADGKVLVAGYIGLGFDRLINDPAPQSLTAPNTSQVLWSRGGASPDVSQVTFGYSASSGGPWSPLGKRSAWAPALTGSSPDFRLPRLAISAPAVAPPMASAMAASSNRSPLTRTSRRRRSHLRALCRDGRATLLVLRSSRRSTTRKAVWKPHRHRHDCSLRPNGVQHHE